MTILIGLWLTYISKLKPINTYEIVLMKWKIVLLGKPVKGTSIKIFISLIISCKSDGNFSLKMYIYSIIKIKKKSIMNIFQIRDKPTRFARLIF